MSLKQFFHEVNATLGGSPAEQTDSSALESALRHFLESHRPQVESLDLAALAPDQMGALSDKLLEFTGTVVDVLEPKMMVTKVRVGNSVSCRAFSFLCPEAIEQPQFDLMSNTNFAELTAVVVLVPTRNTQLSESVWKKLGVGKSLQMAAPGVPVLVHSVLPREKFQLGKKMRLTGLFYAKTETAPESHQNWDGEDLGTLEFYDSPGVPQMVLLDCGSATLKQEKAPSPSQSETDQVRSALDELLQSLARLTGDQLSARLAMFSLAAPPTSCQQQTDVAYLNLNIFGLSTPQSERIRSFLEAAGFQFCFQKVAKAQLAGKLAAEQNHEYGVLQLNRLFPGMESPLLLDETEIEPAKLSEVETFNILLLSEIVESQLLRVKYFEKNYVSFHFGNPLLVLSGERSVFKPKLRVLAVTPPQPGETPLPTEADAQRWTRAVEKVREWVFQLQLREGDADQIQQDFVETRKQNKDFSGEDFAFLLLLARYVAAFRGEPSIGLSDYREAKELMREVQGREAATKLTKS